MPNFHQIVQEKQKYIDRLDQLIAKLVLTTQESLRKRMLDEILPMLTLSDNQVKNTASNLRTVNHVKKVFDIWAAKDGVNLANSIATSILQTHRMSEQYYSQTLSHSKSKSEIKKTMDAVLKSTMTRYGIERIRGKKIRGVVKPTSYIITTIADETISKSLQNVIRNSILSEQPFQNLKRNIGIALGRGSVAGEVERRLGANLPNAALQADREINIEVRQGLQLNYAFYQGGEIKTTRPFCSIRNNKVFSHEEISKFGTSQDKYGGYTNKSTGEFQGKTKVYDPFLDLGGYNCRHSYDWISDEMAKIFRPELFVDGFNEKIKHGKGTIEIHQDHGKGERSQNINAAKKLLDQFGGNIKLLPTTELLGLKNLDAIYNGNLYDIKSISGNDRSIDSAIKSLKSQFSDKVQNMRGILITDKSLTKKELRAVLGRRLKQRDLLEGENAFEEILTISGNKGHKFTPEDFK